MKKIYYKIVTLLILFICIGFKAKAQTVNVQIDATCQRFIEGISELDRTKFFTVHDASNDSDAITFRNDYNVTGGRGFWGPFPYAKNQTGSVGVYPDDRAGNDDIRPVKKGFVATGHPRDAFFDGIDLVSAREWAAEYFKDFVDQSGRQEFFEVMNEPFVHAGDFYSGGWNSSEEARIRVQMSQFYNEVGKKIKETPALSNMKVIGYSAAWPTMEKNDFGQWNDWMKMFMDVAGDNMYGFSTHLYDGINVTGQDSKRSGSNSEAILDLIENYSFIKWGATKPHAITEYGAIEKGYGDDYSEIASAQTMISINHILFSLLNREDRIATSIPFITGKATWHINADNNYQPYTPALWIPSNIGEANPTGWHYSPRIHFYELWKDVKGKRILIKSDNPDVQVHAFVDNTKMYVALSNLDEETQMVNLQMPFGAPDLDNVKIKALKVYAQDMPDMSIETVNVAPSAITLIKDETVVLEYNFNSTVDFDNALRTKNYYTSNYLEAIAANSVVSYNFNGVTTGDGYATLRMSIGRKHNVSKKPIVTVNGTVVEVPNNWKGYDQANRDDFFGMIKIPFPAHLLQGNNTVTVQFPDSGGRISSLILSVELFDTPRSVLSVQSVGNPCPGSSVGKISIDPFINDSYEVHITGASTDETYNFSSSHTIENLAGGTYNLIITSTTNSELNLEYSIEIHEPEALEVSQKVDYSKGKVLLKLQGSDLYRIDLNGEITVTDKDEVTLDLNYGENNLLVKTNKDCQGEYNQSIDLFNQVVFYPNPVKNKLTLDLPTLGNDVVHYKFYSITGQLVLQKSIKVLNRTTDINVEGLTPGMYFLNVTSPGINFKSKIVKQ